MATPLLQLVNIRKEFPGVLALDKVNLDIREGEVLALVGENGAGKSTLIKILAGALEGYEGEILWKGEPFRANQTWEVQQAGISTIYQELTSCPELSVAENIFLGREPKKKGGIIDWKKMNDMASEVLDTLHMHISPSSKVSTLTVANQQLIEIARALTMEAKLIIMDEPTSSLSEHEVKTLCEIVKKLREQGISVLYISHKFEEIFELSDRISVLRDGKYIGTRDTKDASLDEILAMMVGRSVDMHFVARSTKKEEVVLKVDNLTSRGLFENISFELHRGEILGISGLVGAGRTEMARGIFGVDRVDSGSMVIYGEERRIPASPGEALKLGIGFLPEDRKEQGLVLMMSIGENVTLPSLAKNKKNFVISFGKEKEDVEDYIKRLSIKTPSLNQLAQNLSGGNQQKVVIAKWLASKSKILIFDEPTRGIDIGAKAEIYDLMNELVAQDYSIIMISSELPEVMGMSDRIMVMHEGKQVALLDRDAASPEEIMGYATGAM